MITGPDSGRTPVQVVRIIARLNIGGPAIQAITLTKELERFGYTTTLVRGSENPREGNMDHLAAELGVEPVLVPSLRRDPGWHDIRALIALIGIVRRVRPAIVHTHAAKGGTLGRLATIMGSIGRRRPVLIHTYHGHSLSGYFVPRTTAVYRRIERTLARRTDRLIAVSPEVRDELVAMSIAPASKFEVIPLGFDLSRFLVNGDERGRTRERIRKELGIPATAQLVTLVARLVRIKRVDRFLRVAGILSDEFPRARFLVVGDGELASELQASPEARALNDRVVWAGFRRDMASLYFASDVVVQTSDNEGTPVSLLEAQAAGVPVVSTRVGGTKSAVDDGRSGFLAPPGDDRALAAAVRELVTDPVRARQMGTIGREQALGRFGLDRLVDDIQELYRRLEPGPATSVHNPEGRCPLPQQN